VANRIVAVQVSDTTDDDSSNAADPIIKKEKLKKPSGYLRYEK